MAARRDPPVGGAGGAVVGVGGTSQVRVAQRPRRDVQRVGGRPRGVRRGARIGHGAVADVFGGGPGLAGRVPVDLVPFRGGEPWRSGTFRCPARWPVPALPQAGQGEPGGQPAAAVPQRCSVRPGVAGEGDGIPGDLSRIGLAEPHPHQHPGLAQPGEEPGLVGRLFRRLGDRGPQRAADRRGRNTCSGERPVFRADPAQRARSFGKVRSAASFPPPYQTTPPSRAVWPGSPTAYPVT